MVLGALPKRAYTPNDQGKQKGHYYISIYVLSTRYSADVKNCPHSIDLHFAMSLLLGCSFYKDSLVCRTIARFIRSAKFSKSSVVTYFSILK